MIPNKFVIFWNNRPVGVDSNSGGYPYKTEHPALIRYWDTRKEAQTYWDVFLRVSSAPDYSYQDYSIKEIQFRIV